MFFSARSFTFLMLSVSESVRAESADFYNNQGREKLSRGDYYGALSDFTKLIELNPSSDAYFFRGLAKGKLGDNDGAISDYNKSIELDPSPGAYYNRGRIKMKLLKDYQGAISDFEKAIELNPNYGPAHLMMGRALVVIEDYYAAIAAFDKYLEINPNSSKGYVNRAIAKGLVVAFEDKRGACRDLKKAVSLGDEMAENYLKRDNFSWCRNMKIELNPSPGANRGW